MISGIVLSGGGARGAYQAGVIQALAELSDLEEPRNPFRVVSGISAGAINASYLASNCNNIRRAGRSLAAMWSRLSTDQIVSVNPFTLGRIGLNLVKQLSTGAITRKTPVSALLDTAPLEVLLRRYLKPQKIQKRIDGGDLLGLAITATAYSNSHARSFVQAKPGWQEWQRVRRESQAAMIGIDHIMASSAIPVLFPPHQIDGAYYGDGGIRNTAPLSPAIHLGAEQLIVVGVRMNDLSKELPVLNGRPPSLARIFGVLVHGMLMDAVDVDVERLIHLNEMAGILDRHHQAKGILKKIDYIWISPSRNLGEIALKWSAKAPASIRYFVKGLGSEREAADLFSYLLFEREYCQELVQLGYEDTMVRKDAIKAFFARATSE